MLIMRVLLAVLADGVIDSVVRQLMSAQAAVGRFCDFSRPDVTLRYAWPCVTSTLTGVWPTDIVPDMSPDGREVAIIENVIVGAPLRGRRWRPRWPGRLPRLRGCATGGSSGRETPRRLIVPRSAPVKRSL